MASNWNFRRSVWTGRLILQRFRVWSDDGRKSGEWQDADILDLRDYFAEFGKPLPDNAGDKL